MVGWEAFTILAVVVTLDALARLLILPRVLAMFEHAPTLNALQMPPDPDARPIAAQTVDGLQLRGSLLPPLEGRPVGTVIFCHEFGGDHHSAAWYCAGLRSAGFAVVAFDFRSHGDSEAPADYVPLHWLTQFEINDALAAIEFVRGCEELRALPLGMMGISRGGGAALAAAARSSHVAAVACEGAFSTDSMLLSYARRWITVFVPEWAAKLVPQWHIQYTLFLAKSVSQFRRNCHYTRLERWLPRLRHRQLLLVADGADSYVDLDVTRSLCRAAGHPESSIWRAPLAKHNQARRSDPVAYDARLQDFFGQIVERSAVDDPAPYATA